jgi:hypothetical protein
MFALLRHLLAIAVLPYMVAVQIPIWIARRNAIALVIGSSSGALALQAVGVAVLAVGFLSSRPRSGASPARGRAPSLPGIRRGISSSADRTASSGIR